MLPPYYRCALEACLGLRLRGDLCVGILVRSRPFLVAHSGLAEEAVEAAPSRSIDNSIDK